MVEITSIQGSKGRVMLLWKIMRDLWRQLLEGGFGVKGREVESFQLKLGRSKNGTLDLPAYK